MTKSSKPSKQLYEPLLADDPDAPGNTAISTQNTESELPRLINDKSTKEIIGWGNWIGTAIASLIAGNS